MGATTPPSVYSVRSVGPLQNPPMGGLLSSGQFTRIGAITPHLPMIKASLCLALLCAALAPLHAAKTPPQFLTGSQPVYPEQLKARGEMGEAKITTHIDATGAVTDASVKSATHEEFGAAALAAVKAWRFKPAEEDGKPIAMSVTVPLRFTLTPKELFNAEVGRAVFVDESKITEKIHTWDDIKKWINFRGKNANRVPYPPELKGRGISEEITVQCLISPEGYVLNPTLVGLQNKELAVPVMKHVAAMRFEAPTLDGKRVYVRQRVKLICSEDPNFGVKPAKKN